MTAISIKEAQALGRKLLRIRLALFKAYPQPMSINAIAQETGYTQSELEILIELGIAADYIVEKYLGDVCYTVGGQ